MPKITVTPRQLAFLTLRAITPKGELRPRDQGGFADVELDQRLRQHPLEDRDRRFLTELVYGTVRRQRTLDALIDQLGKKKANQQPPDLRLILHVGLYQLRYLSHIPASAAVHTTVELAKSNGFSGLTGFVNGLLRQYQRVAAAADPLQLPADPVQHLGIKHSFPDWIVSGWLEQLGFTETEQLCESMNRTPAIDLRINPLRTSLEQVETALQTAGVKAQRLPGLPQALRLESTGAIVELPGFQAGWWMVQDSSAQLVGHLVAPQPGEVVIDACAAPGGKSVHLAELMADQGTVWACDRSAARLKKLQENAKRLGMQSIQVWAGDSRQLPDTIPLADRLLLDAPCSGLGTLHRHADARWRQTPTSVAELAALQLQLLTQAATHLKPGGSLVYSTCTLHPLENEGVVQQFLTQHPQWQIDPPPLDSPTATFAASEGWVKVWPHRHQMDGFFMVKLKQN